MAFSMCLRNTVNSRGIFQQQVKKFMSQSVLTKYSVARTVLANSETLKGSKLTPIFDYVQKCSFKTSPVHLSGSHDHSKLWVVEKITSGVLIPLIPIALIIPNRITDSLVAILITAHSFWGLEAIVVDYVRASIFGPFIPKIAMGLLYLISFLTLGGLFYIITHDIGISNTVRQLWAIKSNEQNA